jgi:hypothetical protein
LTLGVTILAASPSMAALSGNGWGSNGWGSNGWGSNGWGSNGWGTNGWGTNGQTMQADGHAIRIIGIELPR